MKLRFRTAIAGLGAVALTGGVLLSGASQALAATPPYEPDHTNQFGQLTFYNATGHVITSGNINDAPFAKYIVTTGATDPVTTNTKATLYGYLPVGGTAPGAWSGDQMSAARTFPNSGAPAPINATGAHRPVVTTTAADETIATLAADFPNTATDSYQGLYQLRVKTASNTKWWAADIQVTGNTWTQVYPSPSGPPSGTVALTGPHRVGMTDTCKPSFAHATSYAYKWFASGSRISGASKAKYKIAEKYYRKTLACKVTATGPGGSTLKASTGHRVGKGPALAPVKKPYLRNGTNRTTVKHGHTEKVNHGTWRPKATSYSYQWYLGSHKIKHATKASYTPKASAVGKKLYCVVTAKRHAWTNGKKKTAGVKVT